MTAGTENEFQLDDYLIDSEKVIYSLPDLIPKDANIILAGLYDENTILNLKRRKYSRISWFIPYQHCHWKQASL